MVIAGVEGVGKSTMASGAPGRLYVPTEIGGKFHNSLPLVTQWETVLGLLDELIATAQAGNAIPQSIVWDSATAMERLLFDYTVRNDPDAIAGKKLASKLTMETSHGAYGKAYAWARDRFEDFLAKCDLLATHVGTNHIFTCHVFTTEVVDPTVGSYHQHDLLLHSPRNSKTYGVREFLTQRADFIGFLNEPILVSKGEKFNQALASGQGRQLLLDRIPGAVAKNRYGLSGSIAIPVEGGWNVLASAIWESTKGQIDVWAR